MIDPIVAAMLDAVSRAPSPHNTQPWALTPHMDRREIWLTVRPERTLPAADPEGRDTLFAMGAALENMLLTLDQLGTRATYRVMLSEHECGWPSVDLKWEPTNGNPADPLLFRMIPLRGTSRLPYAVDPVDPKIFDWLEAMMGDRCRLHALTEPASIDAIRRLIAQVHVRQMQTPALHGELYGWMRFTPRDPRWHRDGLSAAAMELTGPRAAACRILFHPTVMRSLTACGLTTRLFSRIDDHAPQAPALCLITMRECDTPGRIEAGRCLQRTWLAAAAKGLATHPLSAGIDDIEARTEVFRLFGVDNTRQPVTLFRLGHPASGATAARSARLPADEILATSIIREIADP